MRASLLNSTGNPMKKIITIVGARPQFIKANILSRHFAVSDTINEIIIHTGQHYDDNMSDVFFTELGIPKPGYNLGIGGGTHGQMTGRQLEKVEQVLLKEKPDMVLVYGDTNSTLAGALSAAQLKIPLAHVEAGLRAFNRNLPEETNRIVTDHLSKVLFCPTEQAVINLKTEGISHENVLNVGDIMYDAALLYAKKARKNSSILERLNVEDGTFRLSTLHRPDNTSDNITHLEAILEALRNLSKEKPHILPMHPRTRNAINATGRFDELTHGLTIIDPVGYIDMVRLIQGAEIIVTDSGGLQKEAYFHQTPVVILRHETEWEELLDMKWAKLASPADTDLIIKTTREFDISKSNTTSKPYGIGDAGQRMYNKLIATI